MLILAVVLVSLTTSLAALAALTTLLTLLTLLLHHLLLHLLHLLHHLGIHVGHHVLSIGSAAATASHHLLHLLHLHHVLPHGWVHGHIAAHGHLRLHHGKVLLHALEVLSHDLRCHAVVSHLLSHTSPSSLAGLVVFSELAASLRLFFLSKIAPRLSSLDFDRLAMDFQRNVNACFDSSLALESDEAKASWPAGILVHHKCCVDNSAKLGKVILELLVCCLLTDTTNEDLAGFLLFIAGNSTLRINLCV